MIVTLVKEFLFTLSIYLTESSDDTLHNIRPRAANCMQSPVCKGKFIFSETMNIFNPTSSTSQVLVLLPHPSHL
jgi:hypothetical protein